MPLVIPLRPEERVAENNVVNVIHGRIIDDIPINKEEDRQVDLLPSTDLLLLKAETLDLGEIRRNLPSAQLQNTNPPSPASYYK